MNQFGRPGQIRSLQPLRGFACAARLGSVTRAAEVLGLDQSTISLQIKSLETALEAVLFERAGRGIRLTPDGEILLKIITPLLEGIDRLPLTFSELRHSEVEGTRLGIATVESILLYVLPSFIAQFRAEFPAVQLDLVPLTSRETMEAVRSGRVDLGIVVGTPIPPDLTYQEWFKSRSMLIVPKGHPLARLAEITLADITGYPFVLLHSRYRTRSLVESTFIEHGLYPSNILETGGAEVIKRYVRLGLGVSVLPEIAVANDTVGIEAIPVDHLFPPRQYGIVSRAGQPTRATSGFLRLLTRAMA